MSSVNNGTCFAIITAAANMQYFPFFSLLEGGGYRRACVLRQARECTCLISAIDLVQSLIKNYNTLTLKKINM